jgi:hypothetical protein
MARLKHRAAEAGLREFLLEQAVYLRDTYGPKMPEAWDVFSRAVDALLGGEAIRLYAWELPEGHPAFKERGVNAMFILTEDDELVPSR